MPGYNRDIGNGTHDDPRIMWTCSVTRDTNRTEGCEKVSREGCDITGSTHVWIRHVDHDTTRTRTRGGRRTVRTDPHLTVYMSTTSSAYEYEGHLFLVYRSSMLGRGSKVPKRLAGRRDLRYHRGPNPELWYSDRRSRNPVIFRNMAA
ncbi:hypothetical protein QBC37DRAFT_20807 [Rhypophila decipiens]|uniref:Uncharacterized protein n=1 Tax=Rhypophila decipiens TaxID=261697 RepID=A0AAN6Y1U2_9PEZI|nr:hypothetical protein QBC37DRAFT_20807 [Rhypophila decipiens]